MMRFSFALLGLLVVTAAAVEKDTNAASRGRGLRQQADILEASMSKLHQAIHEQGGTHAYMSKLHQAIHKEQFRATKSKDNHFSQRLVDVEMKHKQLEKSKAVNSMKEAIDHLTAAQDETNDMGAVLSNLKSAVSKMNSFVAENHNRRRGLVEDASALDLGAEDRVSATDFHKAVQCAAIAAHDDDVEAFVSCTKTIQHGVEAAILKVNKLLDSITIDEMEKLLSSRLSEAKKKAVATDDPAAMTSVIAETIGQLLDDQASDKGDVGVYDFLMMLWMVPVSIVWGGFLWLFIGLWTYGAEYGILGSLYFEITWILSGLGCLFAVEAVCGIWEP